MGGGGGGGGGGAVTCDQSQGGKAGEGMQVNIHRVERLGEIDDGSVPGAEAPAALRPVQHHAGVKHQTAGAAAATAAATAAPATAGGQALLARRSPAPGRKGGGEKLIVG